MVQAIGMAISSCGALPPSRVQVSQCFAYMKAQGFLFFRPAAPFRRAQLSSVPEGLIGSEVMKIKHNLGEQGAQSKVRGTVAAFRDQPTIMDESQVQTEFLRKILAAMAVPYLHKNHTAATVLDMIREHDQGPVVYDHFAYRTFGIDGCGISSIGQMFLDLGYEARDELLFPAKKLRALWFSPPDRMRDYQGDGINGPLPRIFISELLVDELSAEAQKTIRKYASCSAPIAKHAALASATSSLTWPTPELPDYQQLARESEYAAWTLVNGYSLNHVTVSVHRLQSKLKKIDDLNAFLRDKGVRLNSEGSILKVSPDGGLRQSSTVADTISFTFAGGEVGTVAASYIEFAERLVLPKFQGLDAEEIHEWHRRDGFEVGNADKIFESTSVGQIGVPAS